MNDFRAIVAILLSCVSGYLVVDLLLNGFSWTLLFGAIVGFLLVHYIWPPKTNSGSAWYDLVEFIFDLPYRCIAFFIRGLGRVVKGASNVGADL